MGTIKNWLLMVITGPRSGKKRLYIAGHWPDGTWKNSSAVVVLSSEGLVRTHSGSEYQLEGPDKWGRSVQEATKAVGDWVPAGK
jgi:hypothetical protein